MEDSLSIFNFKSTMNLYISRIIKIVIFILLITITDQVVGLILRKLYFNQKTGANHALTYTFRDCKADILIFGASQAQHNFDSRIISDSLKMSCYNAGQDGGHSIILQYAQIKVITKRYSPKIIILDFHPDRVVHFAGDYDRLSILLPYYKDFPEIRSLILLRSPYERVKLMSAIYPFNSNVINIIRFNTNTHAARKQDFEGYVPLKEVMNIHTLKQKHEVAAQSVSVVDSNMVNALKNIIHICKEKNIFLFIISSPIFHTVNEKQSLPSSVSKMSLDIIHSNKVNYVDFSFDSTFAGHFEWFKDRVHLNDDGAKVFTNKLADMLKKINIISIRNINKKIPLKK
jgi:hypothetical protein